ncbi:MULTISPECIES: DUF7521 family protein [Halorussus]|uniref:DUF7521 family protein n=1 Tax=Halorussus TaxID=1070314 RepID=UPI00209D9B5F|nr:hypothetical protein [Halorussus vallis]USZ76799.1 hypothetical protein NGM07_05595 [Halorussus vallis]
MSALPSAMDLHGPWLAANFVLLFVLGFLIVYQAIRGYRRNGGRPMLFLALGIVLLTIVPTVIIHVGARWYSMRTVGLVISPLANSVKVVGLASIVYSLYGRR